MRLLQLAIALLAFGLLPASIAAGQTVKGSWGSAKKSAEDNVYHDNLKTIYCGCGW